MLGAPQGTGPLWLGGIWVLAWVSIALVRWWRARRSRRRGVQLCAGLEDSLFALERAGGSLGPVPWGTRGPVEDDRVEFGASGRQVVGGSLLSIAAALVALVVGRATRDAVVSTGAWCAAGAFLGYSAACARVRVAATAQGLLIVPRLGRQRQFGWSEVSRLMVQRREPPVSLYYSSSAVAVGVAELVTGEIVDLPGLRSMWQEDDTGRLDRHGAVAVKVLLLAGVRDGWTDRRGDER